MKAGGGMNFPSSPCELESAAEAFPDFFIFPFWGKLGWPPYHFKRPGGPMLGATRLRGPDFFPVSRGLHGSGGPTDYKKGPDYFQEVLNRFILQGTAYGSLFLPIDFDFSKLRNSL